MFEEAARRLGLTRQTLLIWVHKKKIKSRKEGKERFVAISEVERFQ